MEITYDIINLILAILIIFFSATTVYFGLKYLLVTKMKKEFDWIVLLQTLVSLAWVIIFGYIAKVSLFNYTPIQEFSFETLFIRPVILVSSLTIAVWMNIRYKFEKSGRSEQWNQTEK